MLADITNRHSDSELVVSPEKPGTITLTKKADEEEYTMPKDIKDIEISKPSIMAHFEHATEERKSYSNNVELLDLLPRYMKSNPKRDDKGRLDPVTTYPKIRVGGRSLQFEVTTIPARIKNKGPNKKRYPNVDYIDTFALGREQTVEMLIRKKAFSGDGKFLDGKAGVFFTLSGLSKDAKEVKAKLDKNMIKESIEILSKVEYEVKCIDDSEFPDISIKQFGDKYIQSNKAYHSGTNDAKCYVILNSLITAGIENKTLIMTNIKRCLGYKDLLAVWFDTRISINFRQADHKKNRVFRIKLSTIGRDSKLLSCTLLRDNKKQVVTTLKKLIKAGTLSKYSFEDIKDGRKIVDVRFFLDLSEKMIDDIVEGNILIEKALSPAEKMAKAKRRINNRNDDEKKQIEAEDNFNSFKHGIN